MCLFIYLFIYYLASYIYIYTVYCFILLYALVYISFLGIHMPPFRKTRATPWSKRQVTGEVLASIEGIRSSMEHFQGRREAAEVGVSVAKNMGSMKQKTVHHSHIYIGCWFGT